MRSPWAAGNKSKPFPHKTSSSWLSISLVWRFLILVGFTTLVMNLVFLLSPATPTMSPGMQPLSKPARQSLNDIIAKRQVITAQQVEQDALRYNNLDEEQADQQADEDKDDMEEPDDLQETHAPVSLEKGREQIIAIFRDAGIELDEATLASLPSWNQVLQKVGPTPVIYGLDSCAAFRAAVPAVERSVGCCGMFNSGTNLVTRLLKENCKIPERIEYYGWNGTFEKWGMGPGDSHGMRWQVPWGKHTAARYREMHTTKHAVQITKESLLPIVTIRHPYDWMKSMCKNPYTAKWSHGRICPHLVWNRQRMKPVNLTVKYGDYEDVFDSLAHLWNGWYYQYWKEATYPFLIVRFEDLIFHARNVTTQICHCAGGIIRTDRPFFHIVQSAKDGPGHGRQEERTNMVQAWIKYGNEFPARGGFNRVDYRASRLFLDQELMRTFRYRHPKAKE